MTIKPTYEELEQKVKVLEELSARSKQVEESLQDTEKHYHLLFDHSPDGILIIDPATAHFLDFNETAHLQLGYSREEFSKLSIFDLEVDETPEETRSHMEYVIKHGISDFETRQRTKQGKIINLHVTAQYTEVLGKPVYHAICRDITDDKRMAEELRENEEYTKSLFSNSYIPLIVMDAETGIYIDCNAAAVQIYGYASREDVLGKTPLDVSAPIQYNGSDSATEAQKHIKIGREKGSHIFEWRHQRPNGQIWDAYVHLMLLQYRGKSLIQFMLQDITDRKRMEAALRESERRLADIIDFLPDPTFAIDLSGKIIAWNHAIEEMTSVKAEDVLGKGNYEYAMAFYGMRRPMLIDLAFGFDEEIAKKYDFVKREENVFLAESDVSVRGVPHTIWGKAGPLYDSNGSIVGAIESVRDVTELKKARDELEIRVRERTAELQQANKALQKSEAILRSVFKATPVGLCIMKDRVFQSVNKTWLEICGYSESDLIGHTPRLLFEEEKEYELVGRKLYTRLSECDLASVQTKHRRKNGDIRDVILTAAPLHLDDTSVGMAVVTVEDITKRKKAEEALRESEEKFRGIYEESPIGIELYDREGTLLEANEACLDIFGISDAKAVKGFKLFEDPNLSEKLKAQLQKGESVRYEMLFDFGKVTALNLYETTKKGIIYLDVLITPLRGATKESDIGYLVQTRDITKRKQAEEALRESEKQVRRKLDAILSPEGDIGTLELSDIIDTEKIQKLMDEFFDLTNLPMTITDIKGKVLVGIGWQDICTHFHRVNPESCRLCIESDLELTGNVPVGTFKKYRCKNNMWDIATPIMLGDKCLGNIFMGQFLFDDEKPDYETFRQQARKYGFDEQEYIAALDRVSRWSKKTINKAMSFFTSLAGIIGNLGYSNIKLANALEERKRAEEALRKSEEKFRGIYEKSPIGIELYDRKGTLLDANKACLDILGVSDAKALKGFKLFENHNLSNDFKAQLRSGESVSHEIPYDFERVKSLKLYETMKKGIIYLDVLITPLRGVKKEFDIGYLVQTLDITKRKQAEQALRESETKCRRLHESMTEAFASVDMNGRIQEFNRAYQSMLGYSEEELCHLTYSDITPEKWHALEKSIVEEQIVLHGYSNVYEKEYQRKDGSVFPVEISTFLIRDDAGNPVGMWAIVRDITERKKLETELNAARDYLRTVFNNVYDAIFVHDLDGKVIDVNDKMLEMYSISREEAVGLNITRDYSATDESMEELRSNWNKVMSGEHIFTEWKARRPKDGSIFDVEVYLSKLVLSDGDYILANVRDITERKLAEEALKESEKKYNQFFKTSRDCVFITNDGILIDINDAAVELLGYSSREELLQVKVPDLYAEPEEWIKHSSIISEHGYGKEYPVEFRRKDGSIRHTLVTSAARFDTNGNLIGFQGTVRDVTEQRRNEEELKKYREELEILVAERTSELEEKTKHLQEINTAMNVLLQKREEDKKILEERFVENIGSLVLPYVEKTRKSNLDAQQQFCLDIIEKNLNEIVTPLLKNIQQFNLTPREFQVASLINDGKTTKEIAKILGIAKGSIDTHRKNIRKKLGLDRTSNLQSNLRFLEK